MFLSSTETDLQPFKSFQETNWGFVVAQQQLAAQNRWRRNWWRPVAINTKWLYAKQLLTCLPHSQAAPRNSMVSARYSPLKCVVCAALSTSEAPNDFLKFIFLFYFYVWLILPFTLKMSLIDHLNPGLVVYLPPFFSSSKENLYITILSCFFLFKFKWEVGKIWRAIAVIIGRGF